MASAGFSRVTADVRLLSSVTPCRHPMCALQVLRLPMAPGIPGGPQLKFLCLGNNTRVTEATGNMSEIPKELLGLTKTPNLYILIPIGLCGKELRYLSM